MKMINKANDWYRARLPIINVLDNFTWQNYSAYIYEFRLLNCKLTNINEKVNKLKNLKRKQSKRRALVIINNLYAELHNDVIMFKLKL